MKLNEDFKQSARRLLKKGGDLATTLVHLNATTTTIGRVGAVLGVAGLLLGEPPDMARRYEGYEVLDLRGALQSAVVQVLREGARLTAGDSDGKQSLYTLSAFGGQIVWLHEKGEASLKGPWLVGLSQDQATAALGQAVWETLGSRVTLEVRRWGEEVVLSADDLTKSQPSGLSRNIAKELSLYRDAQVPRAMLLHGPPRTGKSYVVRDVAEALGSFSLRFCNFTYGGESLLVDVVKLLRPKTLIMDDICRTSTSGMLDAIERVRSVVPVVLATANYTDKIDPAMLGPGRFDRSLLVERVDEETFDMLTKDLDAATRSRLREAPIGYLSEFLTELAVEGQQVAVARLDELLERAEKVKAAPPPTETVKAR